MMILVYSIIGYIIGAIPTGWIVANFFGVDDITKYGSGNIGATNVGRILGLKYFFFVLLLDSLKAFAYIHYLSLGCAEAVVLLSAVALLIGNGISIFLHGKGGKGIATSIGIVFALNPVLIYEAFFIWLFTASLAKNMGISCVVALLSLPFLTYFFVTYTTYYFLFILFLTCWGLWRHAQNIKKFFSLNKATL